MEPLGLERIDRRALVKGGAASGLGLAASGTLVSSLTFAQDAEATPASESASAASATPAIASAASDFLVTLDDAGREAVLFAFDDSTQRQRWSNFPEGLFERDGLMWGNLSAEQQEAWLAVMQATLSEGGFARIRAEWAADDELGSGDGGGGDQGGGPGGGMQYGQQYYWVAIIGEPFETDPWQWQWGGHHVTVNATIQGAEIPLTPSFIGVQPATYTDADGNEVRPLGDIEDAAFALINALDADQQASAILGATYVDLVLGPGQDGKVLQAEGLAATDMTAEQQEMLLGLVNLYADLGNEASATSRRAELAEGLAETYLVWYGSTTQGEAAYFRIQGPRVVIEYSPQSMGGNAADHIHGIYRDPVNDYGALFTGVELVS